MKFTINCPVCFLGLILLASFSPGTKAQTLDTIVFGDAASENNHSFSNYFTVLVTNTAVSPTQTARRCTVALPTNIYGGNLTFNLTVDPLRRNYFSCRLWGGDDGSSSVNGRLYLYVPAAQYTPGSTNNYQIGFRHEGDYMPLSVVADHPPLPGQFFYSTTLLPLWMTQGRTNLTFKIVSTGRIYPLGSGDENNGGNYQFNMATNSRSIYRAYTHTDPFLITTGETQGVAPVATIRPTPTVSVLNPGGTYYNGISNYFKGRLSATVSVSSFGTSDAEFLALAYAMTNMFTYTNSTIAPRVMLICDTYATNYFADTNNVGSGGNEGWGGRYGHLGYAISLMATQLSPNLDTLVNYGAGGTITRRSAWGQMLRASRDYGRLGRDGRAISNQGMMGDRNVYLANKGMLAISDANAFTETNAQRYLKEAVGLLPWLGSDLASGGSSLMHGTNYFMVTSKGQTKEYGYVGADYGEMQFNAADYYRFTGNTNFANQAVKMVKARAPFRRPTMELVSGSYYQNMEGVGLLAWRGASESDGNYADDHVAYADREVSGMAEAAITQDPAVIGYAKQNLTDNQYFYGLTENSANYNGLNFDHINALAPFADYLTVANAADSGIRLPMTSGQPDFAWSDEENGIVAIKHGNERLWLSAYWEAHQGINGAARFHYSTNAYEQYGTMETTPQFDYSGSYFTRSSVIDKYDSNFYTPYDNPLQAYQGERLPVGIVPAPASDGGPFAGRAAFYSVRLGNYLIGMNASTSRSYELKVPPGLFASGSNLVTGASVTVPVIVGPTSTVVLYLSNPTNSNPVPSTPLFVNAVGDSTPQMKLDWNAASGATNYLVKRATVSGGPYTTIATVSGTNFNDTAVTKGVSYYYVVTGTNASGESYYNSMEATTSGGVPSPWLDADIGSVGATGIANYTAGIFTVKGAGGDIGGNADNFNFCYLNLTNDNTIVARLSSAVWQGSTGKIGLMFRESTNSGAIEGWIFLDRNASSTLRMGYRSSTGGGTSYVGSGPTGITPPEWLKLQRVGNTFTSFYSADGSTWTPLGTNTFGSFANPCLGGLAVCSRNAALANGVFDNVTVANWPLFPLAPTNLVATATNALAVLNWSTITNATGYNLKRSLVSGGPYTNVASQSMLTFTNTGLVNGTTYFYIVTATNLAGESANSIEAIAQPTPSFAPVSLVLSNAAGLLQINWPQDHTGWRLQSQTNSLAAGLGTNWATVANSSGTNQMALPVSPTDASVFFRLIYP
jgi:hypothetical protein